MYLNGKRLTEAARLRQLTQLEIQKRSGIDREDIAYYWDNPISMISKADINALAKVLGINVDLLILHGDPPVDVPLRTDKFVTESLDDIIIEKPKE